MKMTAISRLASPSPHHCQRSHNHHHHGHSHRHHHHRRNSRLFDPRVKSSLSQLVAADLGTKHPAASYSTACHSCGVRSSSVPNLRRACQLYPPAQRLLDPPLSGSAEKDGVTDDCQDGDLIPRRTSVAPSSAKLGKLYRAVLLLGFGCVKAAGQKNRLLRKLAFFPPEPPGYLLLLRRVWESKDLERSVINARPYWSSRKGPCGAFSIPHPSFRSPATPQYTLSECSLVLRSTRHTEGLDPVISLQHVGDGLLRLFAGQVKWAREPAIAFAVLWKHNTRSAATFFSSGDLECQIRRGEQYSAIPDLRESPLVIFSHGNSTDIGYSFVSYVQLAQRVQANVLAYDYHGYGASEGKLTDKTGAKNLEVVYKLAVNVFRVPPTRIIVYGQSIGTTSTCALASKPNEFPVGGIILHSPIASGLRLLLGNSGRIPFLDVFHNAELIVNCPWPIQFIHGGQDSDVPLWHCQLLHELAIDSGRPGKSAREVFIHEVSARVEYNCGASPFASELLRSRTDRPCCSDVADGDTVLERWWPRRVHVWIADEAGHNDVEVKYRKEYFNIIRTFVSAYATQS
eukprot:Gregarina_sp_Poly_1__11154@NODE_907_length_5760_cov_97_276656_g646_i0_p1_GENE_NODE_907_length_5760_cov_97_276656_g646_i0NODE_907_length_5760_cov_97_276656_g646_i0_p1_ORF_typecomplete_len571_score23_64DUF818/PF05677_12/2e21Hydrolase_4/PF12146_8/6_7e13Peptidase_S9/PF00326_21/5_8e07Abhydrolase_6/PF12697_7/3e03Abhydrolase_6/PF12697_7/4_7e06Abhydrolase_2/PF02230_16/4_3e05DUF1057/PF06342_12/0_00016DLH/PF01738_18/0_00062Abhydrolase_1/PF00561_20/0_002Abhydrolase_3/PF07859_13/0_023Chlorophyllase2/PF12740